MTLLDPRRSRHSLRYLTECIQGPTLLADYVNVYFQYNFTHLLCVRQPGRSRERSFVVSSSSLLASSAPRPLCHQPCSPASNSSKMRATTLCSPAGARASSMEQCLAPPPAVARLPACAVGRCLSATGTVALRRQVGNAVQQLYSTTCGLSRQTLALMSARLLLCTAVGCGGQTGAGECSTFQ